MALMLFLWPLVYKRWADRSTDYAINYILKESQVLDKDWRNNILIFEFHIWIYTHIWCTDDRANKTDGEMVQVG